MRSLRGEVTPRTEEFHVPPYPRSRRRLEAGRTRPRARRPDRRHHARRRRTRLRSGPRPQVAPGSPRLPGQARKAGGPPRVIAGTDGVRGGSHRPVDHAIRGGSRGRPDRDVHARERRLPTLLAGGRSSTVPLLLARDGAEDREGARGERPRGARRTTRSSPALRRSRPSTGRRRSRSITTCGPAPMS